MICTARLLGRRGYAAKGSAFRRRADIIKENELEHSHRAPSRQGDWKRHRSPRRGKQHCPAWRGAQRGSSPSKIIGDRRDAAAPNGTVRISPTQANRAYVSSKADPPRDTGETQRFFANTRRTTPCVRRNTSKPANGAPERDAPSRALSLPHEKRDRNSLSFLCCGEGCATAHLSMGIHRGEGRPGRPVCRRAAPARRQKTRFSQG